MNEFEATLLSIAKDLRQLELKFALVGGFAVGLRTEPRFTQALDLAVSVVEDSEAEQATMELISRGYSLSHDGTRRPQDRLDLSNLLKRCSNEQIELAMVSVRKIRERGFHRGKELERLLEASIEEFRVG